MLCNQLKEHTNSSGFATQSAVPQSFLCAYRLNRKHIDNATHGFLPGSSVQ